MKHSRAFCILTETPSSLFTIQKESTGRQSNANGKGGSKGGGQLDLLQFELHECRVVATTPDRTNANREPRVNPTGELAQP